MQPCAAGLDLQLAGGTLDRRSIRGLAERLTLALWHPASGERPLVSLSLTTGGKRTPSNTVKVGNHGSVEGSGTISLSKDGSGGTFTVNTAAANGTRITGTIKCEAFTAAIAEGGN